MGYTTAFQKLSFSHPLLGQTTFPKPNLVSLNPNMVSLIQNGYFLSVFKEYINTHILKHIFLLNIDEAIFYIHLYILYLPIKQKLRQSHNYQVFQHIFRLLP